MRIALGIMMMLLSGCGTTGYAFGGLAYSSEAGFPNFDETGVSGHYGLGIEFNDYFKCEFRHRSMSEQTPEIVTNDTGCTGTVYFWGH